MEASHPDVDYYTINDLILHDYHNFFDYCINNDLKPNEVLNIWYHAADPDGLLACGNYFSNIGTEVFVINKRQYYYDTPLKTVITPQTEKIIGFLKLSGNRHTKTIVRSLHTSEQVVIFKHAESTVLSVSCEILNDGASIKVLFSI